MEALSRAAMLEAARIDRLGNDPRLSILKEIEDYAGSGSAGPRKALALRWIELKEDDPKRAVRLRGYYLRKWKKLNN